MGCYTSFSLLEEVIWHTLRLPYTQLLNLIPYCKDMVHFWNLVSDRTGLILEILSSITEKYAPVRSGLTFNLFQSNQRLPFSCGCCILFLASVHLRRRRIYHMRRAELSALPLEQCENGIFFVNFFLKYFLDCLGGKGNIIGITAHN